MTNYSYTFDSGLLKKKSKKKLYEIKFHNFGTIIKRIKFVIINLIANTISTTVRMIFIS